MNMGAHYSKLVSRQLDSQEKIVEREKIIEKKIIIEKEKFVGSSSQHAYDSLWKYHWVLFVQKRTDTILGLPLNYGDKICTGGRIDGRYSRQTCN